MAQRQRECDQRIEQHRQFELVAEAVGNLGRPLRPVRLTQRNILELGLARLDGARARRHHREHQCERQPDLYKHRQQYHPDSHWHPSCLDRLHIIVASAGPPAAALATHQMTWKCRIWTPLSTTDRVTFWGAARLFRPKCRPMSVITSDRQTEPRTYAIVVWR